MKLVTHSPRKSVTDTGDEPYAANSLGPTYKALQSLVGRCHEALRKITEGSPEVVDEGLAEARRILEGPHFDCPACGKSFKVGSETSERIFCSTRCRDASA